MSDDLAADLAGRLRDAHLQIASSRLSQAEKATAARRLIALSDTAKVDLGSASQRLDRLMRDVETGRTSPGGGATEAPSA